MADQAVLKYLSIDTTFDPCYLSLDSTFNTTGTLWYFSHIEIIHICKQYTLRVYLLTRTWTGESRKHVLSASFPAQNLNQLPCAAAATMRNVGEIHSQDFISKLYVDTQCDVSHVHYTEQWKCLYRWVYSYIVFG